MTQDPITLRFLDALQTLKAEGSVRSARQFALAIGTYPQSLNDIIKGRRDATLQMIQKTVEVYGLSAHFLLTGQGHLKSESIAAVNLSPTQEITFIQAHQFVPYAQCVAEGVVDKPSWIKWVIPSQLIGSSETRAFQCDTNNLSNCISRGDVLFARSLPQESWKSNLSSRRVYIVVMSDSVLFVRINRLDVEGIYLRSDERNLPSFISFGDIQEIWVPSTKLSRSLLFDELPETKQDNPQSLTEALVKQTEAISVLERKVNELISQAPIANTF